MLKISLFVLAIFAACQVEAGRLPSSKRFQRQEVLSSAPYPPSGFKPDGEEFELPTENVLPETSAEQLEGNSGIETFDRLKTNVKSEKLVQQQSAKIQTNVAAAPAVQPLNFVSPVLAKIQAVPVQPQLAYKFPLNYATYLQPNLVSGQLQQFVGQQQLVGQQQILGQQQVVGQQPSVELPIQKSFLQPNGQFEVQQASSQPAVDLPNQPVINAQFQQPIQPNFYTNAALQQATFFQQPALFNGQQLLQNYW